MSNLVYRCATNPRHVVTSPTPMQTCPAVVLGSPCRGELVRVDRQRLARAATVIERGASA